MTPQHLAKRIYEVMQEDQKWLVPWEDALPDHKIRLTNAARLLLEPLRLNPQNIPDNPWDDLDGDLVVGPGGTD